MIVRRSALALLATLAVVAGGTTRAQLVSGTIYDDRDGDGVRDADEPGIAGVDVRLFGSRTASGAYDATAVSAADGAFSFTPGDGCYLLTPSDPPGWRLGPATWVGLPQSTPGYTFPVGGTRRSKLDQATAHLAGGALRYSALGDSIARNFNVFCGGTTFWYSRQLRTRLACVAPSANLPAVDEAAVLGEHTDDLLVDDTDNLNNVFRVMDAQPQLVSLSMLGNDLLDVDPGDGASQAEINRAIAEVLDSRRNLQEALSSIVSEVPGADVVLNTLYDNEAFHCAPSEFHRTWLPIVNHILRDLAWGQMRRLSISEVRAEFGAVDQGGSCTGFQDKICDNFLDGIHPTQDGYRIVGEKLWEAAGGVTLGAGDVLGRTSLSAAEFPYLRRVRRLLPRAWEVRNGATVDTPEAALDDQDAGAAASIRLGNGAQEFRLSGFPDWFDEIVIARVIVGVRYRVSGPGQATDDLYRMEASLSGSFDPPAAYDPLNWNFSTPIVGGGGPSQPPENPDYPTAHLLVVPNPSAYRSVSATLSKNPVLPAGASDYAWPAPTHDDLATTIVRVIAAPLPGAQGDDDYAVDLDQAWLDLYGWEKARPDEVRDVRLGQQPDGTIDVSFEPVPGAERYNVYQGSLVSLHSGVYDHGASPRCNVATQSGSGGRLVASVVPMDQASGDSYWLVTAHVDDVESPAGTTSGLVEIDRSQSVCR